MSRRIRSALIIVTALAAILPASASANPTNVLDMVRQAIQEKGATPEYAEEAYCYDIDAVYQESLAGVDSAKEAKVKVFEQALSNLWDHVAAAHGNVDQLASLPGGEAAIEAIASNIQRSEHPIDPDPVKAVKVASMGTIVMGTVKHLEAVYSADEALGADAVRAIGKRVSQACGCEDMMIDQKPRQDFFGDLANQDAFKAGLARGQRPFSVSRVKQVLRSRSGSSTQRPEGETPFWCQFVYDRYTVPEDITDPYEAKLKLMGRTMAAIGNGIQRNLENVARLTDQEATALVAELKQNGNYEFVPFGNPDPRKILSAMIKADFIRWEMKSLTEIAETPNDIEAVRALREKVMARIPPCSGFTCK